MKRIFFWLRWSGRDLRERVILVIAIAATIAIGTGAYASLESLSAWRSLYNFFKKFAKRGEVII